MGIARERGLVYADVLPYFKRAENNTELDNEYHGKGGPLNVTNLRSDNPVPEMFSKPRANCSYRFATTSTVRNRKAPASIR